MRYFLGIIIGFWLGLNVFMWVAWWSPIRNLKSDIVTILNNVDWRRSSFNCDGNILEDSYGNKIFYNAKSIDEAMRELNKVLK